MTNSKWTKFMVTADFNTDLRSLYLAWTTPAGIESWFLRRAEFYTVPRRLREPEESVIKEDTYTWYWHGYGDDACEKGQVLDANGTDLFKFTFSSGSVVTVQFYSRNGVSIVELTQEDIPLEDDPAKSLYVQCQLSWTFYLANLKSVIEGGVDLRNKKLDVPSSFK